MHDEDAAPGVMHFAHEVPHESIVVPVVDADPMLHRHGLFRRFLHGPHAVGNELCVEHQAGAKASLLHARRRAPAVEVVFVVDVAFGFGRTDRECKLLRVGAAELERDRVFRGREAQEHFAVAEANRTGGHHLGIKPRAAGEKPVEKPAVAVRPVEHGRDREAPGGVLRLLGGSHQEKLD